MATKTPLEHKGNLIGVGCFANVVMDHEPDEWPEAFDEEFDELNQLKTYAKNAGDTESTNVFQAAYDELEESVKVLYSE